MTALFPNGTSPNGTETALIVGSGERLRSLGPLLAACGLEVVFARPEDLDALPSRRHRLAVLSDLGPADRWPWALRLLDRTGGCRTIAVVPAGLGGIVVDLYRAGADVVFTAGVDPYHIFLQCSYFMDVWTAGRPAGQIGEAVFEPDLRRLVRPNQTVVRLTEAEARILALLVDNRDQFVARSTISETVFNIPYDKFDRRIDVHISNLRKKLRESAVTAQIDTSRLNGFRLVETAVPARHAATG